jgi:hypothetical protein
VMGVRTEIDGTPEAVQSAGHVEEAEPAVAAAAYYGNPVHRNLCLQLV